MGKKYWGMANVKICPCKDCANRHFLCHAHCEPYIAWIDKRRVIAAKRIDQLRVDDFLQGQSERRSRLPDSKLKRGNRK